MLHDAEDKEVLHEEDDNRFIPDYWKCCAALVSTKEANTVLALHYDDFRVLLTMAGVPAPALPPEPATIQEALSGPHATEWKQAMDKEYTTLQDRGTWVLEQLPEGRRPIGVKWILKVVLPSLEAALEINAPQMSGLKFMKQLIH